MDSVLLLPGQFQAEVSDKIHHLFITNGNVNGNHAIIRTMLRAKDPKVRRARVCEMVAGLVLQETQVTNAAPWLR